MQIDVAVVFWVVIVILLLSFLKAEKLVQITFWSYVFLVLCTALGICILQWAAQLQWMWSMTILWITYASIWEFLINSQPTVMMLVYILWLRFFAINSHLSVQFSWEMFEKKVQTLLWCVLCLGSIISAVYYSLGYFKWEIYDLIFNNSYVVMYTPMIPLVSLVLALLTILASSHLNLKIALKISDSSGV